MAQALVRSMYRKGYAYKKAGVGLLDLVHGDTHQADLFGGVDSGIGSSCDRDTDGLAKNRGQPRLHGLLDGGQSGLGGPTMIVRAIVSKIDSDPLGTVVHRCQCSR